MCVCVMYDVVETVCSTNKKEKIFFFFFYEKNLGFSWICFTL